MVVSLSVDNLLSGATDAAAIRDLAGEVNGTTVRFVPSIHAKAYVADDKCAVVTSGNLTASGLLHNLEYGCRIEGAETVSAVRTDVAAYGALGSVVEPTKLALLAQIAERLRSKRAAAERATRRSLQAEFEQEYEDAQVESIRIRAAGRSMHGIFADAVLFFLSRRAMSTAELHVAIQGAYPDLCDDKLDRIIDGKHFGKKWKHAVRTAQQHLKSRGQIELRDRAWQRV